MARLARAAFGALPHIVVQHAQAGVRLLTHSDDGQQAIELLREAAIASHSSIHAYAVLDDRWMLVTTPSTAAGLADLMQAWSRRFSVAFNRRHGRRGTLWTGRYRAAVLDAETWLLDALLYAELPTLQGQAAVSSVPHHLGQRTDPLITDPPAFWAMGNTPFEREARYRTMLEQGLPSARIGLIEQALRGGWALGPPGFVAELSQHAARPLVPRPRGRPRKAAVNI